MPRSRIESRLLAIQSSRFPRRLWATRDARLNPDFGHRRCYLVVDSPRPFQSLLFLVRDWQCAYEMPYGLEGGQQLLDSRFEGIEDEELRQLRQKILKCFMKIRCFLMPHPGLKVAEEWPCEGRLSDISDKFKLYLPDLVQLLLEPDSLLPKQINGRKITCQELMSYIK
ncbi:hypothetical protein MTO96_045506, partial [Rhipicephalus appendiculatus]